MKVNKILESKKLVGESKQLNETKDGKDELWNQINNNEWAYNTLANKVKTAIEKGLPKERIIIIVRNAIASMKNDFGRCPTTQAERLELAKDFVEDELQGYSFEDGDLNVPSYRRTGTWKRLSESFKPASRGIQSVKCYNQYNYTIQELRIDNDNKTFERGDFTMGKPDKKTKNRQEFEDIVDTLKELGYTEIKSDYRSMRNKSRKGVPTNESIDVATIADYITDHYDFDDLDDKYSCINSIKDSFKGEPTISYEELEQFIGAHNGRDKVNESKSIKEDNKLSVNAWRYRSKANESADRFQKEFYKGYVILRNRGGDGWDIYSYEGTPELEDEGYASLKAAKAEIDKWVKKPGMDESCFSINNKTFGARKKLGKRLLPQNENYGYEEDDNFFNKEELIEFGEEIVEHLNKNYESEWELSGAYEDGKEIEIEVSSEDIGTYTQTIKIDFRKIKRPSDINKYIMAFVAKFNEQIRKDTILNESLGGEYANKILEFAKRSLDKHYDITGILEVVLRYCPEDILRDAWYDKISSLIDDTDDFDLLDDSDPRVAMQDESLIESASEDIPTETLAGPEAGPAAGLAELISAAIRNNN